MANDKDFVVAGAVEVGKDTKVTLGTVTNNDIDLATGNYFADTPTGTSTYTISNAGDVQSFQLEVTGGTAEVAQNFSTTLYTGTNAAQTITNGIDLAGDGGMLWFKNRTLAEDPMIVDTVRGGTADLYPNETNAVDTDGSISSFNSDGFTFINTSGARQNVSSYSYVSWAFKKEPSFFDIVTYTGTGVARTISHNLGSEVGTLIIKRLGNVSGWSVYHRSTGATSALELDSTGAVSSGDGTWNSTAPTTTEFSINSYDSVNSNGDTYVAYLFAHDDAADGLIQCGSYTGTSSSVDISLGWEPQWLLIKRSDSAEDWSIVDNVRGMGTDPLLTGLKALTPNTNSVEESPAYSPIVPSSTGFTAHTGYDARYAANGGTYIYIAIRAASDLDITWPSSIEWAGGVAPSAPATGETDVFTLSTDDGGTSYVGVKTADNLS